MIIANGTIETKRKTLSETKFDGNGFPVAPTASEWGEPIECQYVRKQNNLASVNGEPVREVSYSVYIEEQPFDAEQVRLKDRSGNVLGEFSVIQVEPLEAVCEMRITI